MKKIQLAGLIIWFSFFLYSALSEAAVKSIYPGNTSFSFEENKGQLADEKGDLLPDILYFGRGKGVNVYCFRDRIAFVFTKTAKGKNTGTEEHRGYFKKSIPESPPTLFASRIELHLIGSNPLCLVQSQEKQLSFNNYHYPHYQAGITSYKYSKIIYRNIYSNIDLVLSAQKQGFEYSFIVHPKGKPDDIELEWIGLDSSYTSEDGRKVCTSRDGMLFESVPKCYSNGAFVNSHLIKEGSLIKIHVAPYDSNNDLIIDPDITWATYYGYGGIAYGNGEGAAFSNAIDSSGNVYITGYSDNTLGIATRGAYQTKLKGNVDVFVAKFTKSGTLAWGTYFGGSGYDGGNALCLDNSGNIFVSGNTESNSGVATTGAYSTAFSGKGTGIGDAFLAKFTNTGSLVWSTYFGGNGGENGTGVVTDKSGNVYMCGYTLSRTGIATTGAYQSYFASKDTTAPDGFLAKFSAAGALNWATYYGGTKIDQVLGIALDSGSNIYLTGVTSSPGMGSNGIHQSVYAGDTDAFLAKFSNGGVLSWHTYFGGRSYDNARGIAIDNNNNIFITGETCSKDSIATSGTHQSNIGNWDGKSDAFLARFNNDGSLKWSTYYGGYGPDLGMSTGLDNHGSVYITGITQSDERIATRGAFQVSRTYGYNAFLARFNYSGSLTWATYFGGRGGFVGTTPYSVCANQSDNVFFCGESTNTMGISTSGAYQTFQASSGDYNNAFLAGFSFYDNDAGILSVSQPKGTFCQGNSAIIVMLRNFGMKDLDSVRIGISINKKIISTYSWSGKIKTDSTAAITIGKYSFPPGIDTISVRTYDPNGVTDSIPENDTAIIVDTIIAAPFSKMIKSLAICVGDSIQIGAASVTGHTYIWSSLPAGFSSTSANPVVKPKAETTYYRHEGITATGCSNTDSVVVKVNALPEAYTGHFSALCAGDSIQLGKDSIIGHSYSWISIPPGFYSRISNPIVKPDTTTTYELIEIIKATGCLQRHSLTISVNPSPLVHLVHSKEVCYGDSVNIGESNSGKYSYYWTSNPTGFVSAEANPKVSPLLTTVYIVTIYDVSSGCSKTDSVGVTVNPLPKVITGLDNNVCAGDSIVIGVGGLTGYSYQWRSRPAGFTSNSARTVVKPGSTTTYFLTVTNTKTGCKNTDSVRIRVSPIPVSEFTITRDSASTYTFKAKDTAEISYDWDFGNGSTASSYKTVYTFHKNGTYNIKLIVTSLQSCYSSHDSMLQVKSTGISKNVVELPALNIYPNPFTHGTIFHYSLRASAEVKIVLTDITGKVLAELINDLEAAGDHNQELNVNECSLKPGIYFINFIVNGVGETRKIVKLE